jgi:hypothetical protein
VPARRSRGRRGRRGRDDDRLGGRQGDRASLDLDRCRGVGAEPGAGGLHLLLVEAGRSGAELGDAGVVLAGLVPVAELVGDLGQVEGDRQQQGMFVAVAVRACVEGVFQHPPRSGKVAGLAVQLGQQVGCGQYLGMVFTGGHGGRFEGTLQKRAGAVEVTAVAAGNRIGANRGKRRRGWHGYMLPYLRDGLPPHLKWTNNRPKFFESFSTR